VQPDAPVSEPTAQPGSDNPVRVTVLGTPTILGPDGTPIIGLRKHARQLLVYLAVHRPGADREKIFAEFWPTADPRRAAERLDTEVGDLRRHLRRAAVDDKIQPVVNPGGRYYLDPKIVTVDVWVMVDALREAASPATTPAVRIAALRRAVDAHAGVLSDGHNYDWIDPFRQRIRRDAIRARVGLAHLIAADDPREAADLVCAAAELDPFSEDLARRDMRAQALLGNTDAVRARLDRIRATLDSINEEPADETLALATSLMRQLTRPCNGHITTQIHPADG
jgi:DNA-binding SARP family transcriptional activator